MAQENAKTGNEKKCRNDNVTPSMTTKIKFEGRCEVLRGHAIDCSTSKCADQFDTTVKEITTCLGEGGIGGYKCPGDIRCFLIDEKTQ